jgi:hypothetical protein
VETKAEAISLRGVKAVDFRPATFDVKRSPLFEKCGYSPTLCCGDFPHKTIRHEYTISSHEANLRNPYKEIEMRKVTLTLLLMMLGFASLDVLVNMDGPPNVREGEVRQSSDGTPPPPSE